MNSTMPQASVPGSHPLTLAASFCIIVGSVTAVGYMIGMIGPSTYQDARQRMNAAYLNAYAPISNQAAPLELTPLPHNTILESASSAMLPINEPARNPSAPAAAGTGNGPSPKSVGSP
jgi:hypothetical protein